MTKMGLIERVWRELEPGTSKLECELAVNGLFGALKEALARGENIEIRGFGCFKVLHRAARKARNPRTGEPVDVPHRTVAVFKPSKELKRLVTGELKPNRPLVEMGSSKQHSVVLARRLARSRQGGLS